MIDKFDLKNKDSAIFIMPRSSKSWLGAEALWITVAGWAAAANRVFKNVWVITSDRIALPNEVINYPLTGKNASIKKSPSSGFNHILLFVKIVIKDIFLWRQSKAWGILDQQVWDNKKVAFVWQQHDLFPGPGRKLASRLQVPLITYVHAPVVWEMAKWGVKRYTWGKILERFFESSSLKKSDIVACVSENVAKKVQQLGVEPNKIVVSPMAVDPYLFDQEGDPCLRKNIGLTNEIVVGWTGSFRSFHGLELLIDAFHNIHPALPFVKLMLVGDGLERGVIEARVKRLKLTDSVIFTGRQPFARIPSYISIFDIALVSARSAEDFHYSPLKLREYLVAGKPVLAPDAGEIPLIFKDGLHLKLYRVGDVADLALKLKTMIHDKSLARSLANEGKKYALQSSTWDYELNRLLLNFSKKSKD